MALADALAEQAADGRRWGLIVDEAHLASATMFEEIRVLSNREKEILELLSKGFLYKEIAASLFISAETVRKHVYHIYEKLHVNNRVEAVNKFFGR